jgi:hypothetical protein
VTDRICEIYCVPPIAIARLGGSTTPLAAYQWGRPANPRTDGETVIVPAWSLNILPDGSADPFLPQSIRFRDGALLRPVCPFIEMWVRVGDPANPGGWRDAPLTPDLLAAEGLSVGDLTFSVEARNLKAQRRTGNSALAYGNFEGLLIRGDDHAIHPVLGSSPLGVQNPMIPAGRHIPLGAVQMLRSRVQPVAPAAPWASIVNVEVVRFRFTPAAGLVYGPAQAAAANVQDGPSVQPSEAFLNAAAGWFGSEGAGDGFVNPSDTFDTRSDNVATSLGVVDDTCEARVTVVLNRVGEHALSALANVFAAPPDYAPDRRPFLSIADELNDRDADGAARNAAMGPEDLDAWVSDLFERIYEAVSVLNVDFWRNANAVALAADKLASPLVGDGLPNPKRAMGGEDALRNQRLRVGQATAQTLLPLAEHARERHRNLADVEALRDFVRADPQRLGNLVRAAFESERLSNGQQEQLRRTTMRMPPFMAQSTPNTPLTLAAWQYDLLMTWAQAQQPAPRAPLAVAAQPLSPGAARHRDAVLRHLDAAAVTR